jgi:phytoene synthase
VTDADHCRRIVRTHARTFWLASHWLEQDKRRATFALYAFCRLADDLVDRGPADAPDVRARELDAYRRKLDAALAGRAAGPVFRELALAVHRYAVPAQVLHELLDGVAGDCAPVRYARWSDLHRYCEGVASTVGEMCTYVFGVQGGADVRARALLHARVLGVAMQLTNILRDVGEDARRGRCYLPDDDLARFGLLRSDVLAGRARRDERWSALMAFEVSRARSLYECALPGIALLAPDTQRCASACALGYAGILDAIEAIGYDTVTRRAHAGATARAALAWRVWRTPIAVASGGARDDALPIPTPRDRKHIAWASANQR